MNPFAIVGAAAAALVAGLVIMLKNGMVQHERKRSPVGGGSPDGTGLSGGGEDGGVFAVRAERAAAGRGSDDGEGPAATQAETQQLSNADFGSDSVGGFSEPSVSYSSAGDSGGYADSYAPVRSTAEVFAAAPSGGQPGSAGHGGASVGGVTQNVVSRTGSAPVITQSTPQLTPISSPAPAPAPSGATGRRGTFLS